MDFTLAFLALLLLYGSGRDGRALGLAINSLSVQSGSSKPPSSPGVRLLYQNDLQWDTTDSHTGHLLIERSQSYSNAASTCQSFSESLATVAAQESDLQKQLRYLIYKGNYAKGQSFWVGNGVNQILRITDKSGAYTIQQATKSNTLPALCTQSAPRRQANNSDTSTQWRVSVGDGPTFTGYRDALSFRFWAIPYANTPARFAYSSVYSDTGAIDGTETGRAKQCPQTSGTDSPYTEDCLVLSLYTPFLPSAENSSTAKSHSDLRPILVWIPGGSLNSGSGLDFTFDGGHMASRGDVVVVTINYRLGTLGFLAYNDQIKGNFGFADVITALKWVKRNAATFGGDASKVTVAGQSAGANLVHTLLGSPAASGLFHRAIIQSGRPADKHNLRPTVAEARARSTAKVVSSLGCSASSDILACLRRVSVAKILSSASYSSIVLDGKYVTARQYALSGAGGTVNKVPIIIGYMRDELGSLGYVPAVGSTNLIDELTSAKIPVADINVIMRRKDIFSTVIPHGVQNLTVSVETNIRSVSRCGIAATAYSAASKAGLTDIWAYVQDQRAFQIPTYDPNAACQPQGGAGPSAGTSYYFCHSGDLLPTFATAQYAFSLNPRDSGDVAWVRNQVDQWTSLMRTGDPNPSAKYTTARGYGSVTGDSWPRVSASSSAKLMSLGPRQRVQPLAQHANECSAIGRGLTYISGS